MIHSTVEAVMDMPVIYIDVLFILNLWADFLLLSATARLRHLLVKRWRLLLGAGCGALLSVALFLPPLQWWQAILVRVCGTVMIVLVTFSFVSKRHFISTVFLFFVLSAMFAGGATMLWYFVAPSGFLTIHGVIYYDAPASLLIVFTAVSYVGVCIWERISRRRAPLNRMCRLMVAHGDKTVVCDCLYDSGCTLREPFSGKPAVVMEKGAASPFSSCLQYENTESSAYGSLRFVPFRSLGGEGLLPAFLPERMTVSYGGKERDISGCYLAVSEQLTNGEYVALVGTDIGDLLTEGR